MKFRAAQDNYFIYTHGKYTIYENIKDKQVTVSQYGTWISIILENIDCVKLAIKYEEEIGNLDEFGMEKVTTKEILQQALKNNLNYENIKFSRPYIFKKI
jgi:hypothetical protein